MARYDQFSQADGKWPEEYSGNITEGSVTQEELSGDTGTKLWYLCAMFSS